MSEYTAYFNGEWVPMSRLLIDHNDRGFYKGDVIYDVARTFDGKPYRLKEHVDRLYRSLQYVRIDPGLSPEEMLEISEEAVERNEHLRAEVGDHLIRQYVTRGPGRSTINSGPATVIVKVWPIDFGYYSRCFTDGAHGVIVRTRSYSPEALEPKLKHQSRMNFNIADLEAADVDSDGWAILTDEDGNITEGSEYNVAIITNGVIRTSTDRSILKGESREMIFELGRQLNIPVVEEDIQPYDMYTADEAFFATSTFCALPVTSVDNRQLGDGKPGPMTRQLLAAWSERVGVDIVDQALRFAK